MSEDLQLLLFAIVGIAFSLGMYAWAKRHLSKRDADVRSGKRNAEALLKYLQGVDAFQAGQGAYLEITPGSLIIRQHKVATIAIPYTQITEVAEQYVQHMVQELEHSALTNNTHYVSRLANNPCLIIRHTDEAGGTKSMYFQMVGHVAQFTQFRQMLQERVKNPR